MKDEKEDDSQIKALEISDKFFVIIENTIRQSFDVVRKELEIHRKDQKSAMIEVLKSHKEETKTMLTTCLEVNAQEIANVVDQRQKPRIGIFSIGHTMVLFFEKIAIGLGFGIGFAYVYYQQAMPEKVALTILTAIIVAIIMPIKLGYQIIWKSLTKFFGAEYSTYMKEILDQKDKK